VRTGPLKIAVRNDVLGKPYVEIDAPYGVGDTSPVKIGLWAEDIEIEDARKGYDAEQSLDAIREAFLDWGDNSAQTLRVVKSVLAKTGRSLS